MTAPVGPQAAVDLRAKSLRHRSGFLPTIGSVLILVAAGVRGGEWLEVLAGSLVVVGLFLQAQRSKSVAVADVADVVNAEAAKPLPRADGWKGSSR